MVPWIIIHWVWWTKSSVITYGIKPETITQQLEKLKTKTVHNKLQLKLLHKNVSGSPKNEYT